MYNFSPEEEVCREDIRAVKFKDEERIKETLYLFMVYACREDMDFSDVEDIFGLFYVEQDGYGLMTLDTEVNVYIDDEYYLGHLLLDDEGIVYIVCYSCESDSKRYFRVG